MTNCAEILLVEDSPTQAVEMQYFLEKRGYSSSVAHTGKEALEILKSRKPAIIISDIIMPEMNGFELCRHIKNDQNLRHIPVILLTGLSEPSDVIQGLSAGAEDYILKPYNNEEIVKKIETFLANPVQDEPDTIQDGLEITFNDEKHIIKANRKQILQLLISTYENVIRQNSELTDTQLKLEKLNQELGNKVDELENSQTELKMSEERFKILVQMMPDIVYRVDKEGKFTFVNNAVQVLGYLPGELIGKHFSTIMSDNDSKRVSSEIVLKDITSKETGFEGQPKLFDERRTGERTTMGLEICLFSKNGEKSATGIMGSVDDNMVIVEINSSGLYESRQQARESEFVGSVGVVRDITKRKKAEEAIAQLNEELEIKVTERTKELFDAKQDLEKSLENLNISQQQVIQSAKLASLGTVIAGVTHELNNPLMSVLNYVQYVDKHEKDERLKTYLGKAEREVRRASNIISDLLSYSRPPQPELVAVDCKEVIEHSVELLDINFQSSNIKVTVLLPDKLPLVLANADSLQQVFLNLLINARDAMIDIPEKGISINAVEKDKNICISISDTGPGMNNETLGRIFDPFFTTKEPGKGTGLGLSVSNNIIEGFNGKLTCESTEGNGARFLITLPGKNDI